MPRRALVTPIAVISLFWQGSVLAQNTAGTAQADAPSAADGEVVIDSTASAQPNAQPSNAAPTVTPAPVQAPVGSTADVAGSTSANAPSFAKPDAIPQRPAQAASPGASVERPIEKPAVEIGGYAQLQYESHRDSSDQLLQGGSLLNQDRFLVRRVRLELSRRYEMVGYLLELDANTTNGPAIGIHRAEGALFYAPAGQPLIELTAGLLKVPFGYEAPESSRTRWFMERTTASRAFFPNEVDVGARLHGSWSFLRYGVAITNGEPKGTRGTSFQLQDPNKAKDIILRLSADVPASNDFRLSGGFSYLSGKGFHAGDSATKNSILWNDSNEDGKIDANELRGVPGKAAQPSENFRRWAIGADLQAKLRTRIGWSTLFAEAVAAVNLDRGLRVADPTLTRIDARHLGWHLGFTQELGRYAIVGFRFDGYDPDSDLFDDRGGKSLPDDQTILTYSPLVGLTIPDRARLIYQYDIVRDRLARSSTGVPTDLANDQWTLRLQVNL